MKQIEHILVSNQGNRLTAELINGIYHGIDQAVKAMIEQARAEARAALLDEQAAASNDEEGA